MQMAQLRRQIYAALESDHPQSVRGVFFRMTDPGMPEPVARSHAGYVTVQRLLLRMRREGVVPGGWIADASGRWRDRPREQPGGPRTVDDRLCGIRAGLRQVRRALERQLTVGQAGCP